MNILLIHPPFPSNPFHKKTMPMGLAYIASYLQKELPEVKIRIVDAQAENLSVFDIMKIFKSRRWDIVGISFWTLQAPVTYLISQSIKNISRETLVVHGGVHPSILPKEALDYADIVVQFEGEITFFEIVKAFDSKDFERVKGIVYKRDNEVVKNPPRDFIEDLDALPYPAWSLLPMMAYDTPMHVVGGRRIPVIGSRGCPYNCSFCTSPYMWKRKVRWRSAECVVEEIIKAKKLYGFENVHFWDDNLMLNREYTQKLCKNLIEKKVGIRWVGLTRSSILNKNQDLLPLLRESGCIGLEIGIESVNEITYQLMNKQERIKDMKEAIQNQMKAGLVPMFTFMTFTPGETITSLYYMSRFIDEVAPMAKVTQPIGVGNWPICLGQFTTPHKGTRFEEEAKSQGIIISEGYQDYHHHTINFVPNSLLNDIPVKCTSKLKRKYAEKCKKIPRMLWKEFPPTLKGKELLERRKEFESMIYEFFNAIDGQRTVIDIIKYVSFSRNFDFIKTLKYISLFTVAFSQMGIIRSALNLTLDEIKPYDEK
jgi:radical SAM superfamily enzyme YgiQ (UPF0313 family)